MATLKDSQSGARYVLGCEQEVGRAERCAICLPDPSVSALQASLRWSASEGWQVKDLGSKNGTFLDGKLIDAKEWHPLLPGAVLGFGDPSRAFVLSEASAPVPMAVPMNSQASPRLVVDGVLVLPTDDAPLATIYRGPRGDWLLELPDAVTVLSDQDEFTCGDQRYRFLGGDLRSTTPTSDVRVPVSLDDCHVHLAVSRDEEHVEVCCELRGEKHSLGSHAHDDLLLALARHRAADRAQGLPETSCGWVYQDELATALGTTREQVNLDVFRIRQQFAKLLFAKLQMQGAAQVVERRPRTGQLRTGLLHVTIEKV